MHHKVLHRTAQNNDLQLS